MQQRALLTFTPSLSKLLIAKGLAQSPEVQEAFRKGKMLISTGTTTAHLFGELTGELPEGPLACGMVTPKGLCVGRGMTEHLASHGYAKYWYFDQGQLIKSDDVHELLEGFSSRDIFVKGGNAVDSNGHAGILLGMLDGGMMGRALGHVMAKGIKFIIPVGLEKMVMGRVFDHARELGVRRLDFCSGMPVGLIPVSGTVFTEIEALQQLAKVEAFHVASGGSAGAEGAVTLLVKGEKSEVEEVVNLYMDFRKGSHFDGLEARASACADHRWRPCMDVNIFYKENVVKDL